MSERGEEKPTPPERVDHAPKVGRKGPLAFMAANSVAANLIMIVLIFGGLLSISRIQQEVFPAFQLDVVSINVVYPGASPSEVEQGIILVIEEEVRGIDGVKRVQSTAREGSGTVLVELTEVADPDRALADVQGAVGRIPFLPEDAERPVISLITPRIEVISVAVHGDVSEESVRAMAEEIREDLLDLDEITTVTLAGVRPPEISIEIPRENLRRYGLTLDQVAGLIGAASLDVPAGGIMTERGEILLRTTERRERGQEFEEIVVISTPDGSEVRVRDLGNVLDGFVDTGQEATFNNRPAALVQVFRVGNETPTDVSRAVRDYVDSKRAQLPPTMGLDTLGDRSEIYRDRVRLLVRNALLGLILVLIVLGLFLETKLAFWVTLGIPITFLGALLLMPFFDASLNMISLFAFIVVLGIVVDDAIVVGEAVFEHRHQGLGRLDAAIAGVREVAVPVTFSVLTNIAAFTPLLFVPGVSGQFFMVIPIVVITILALSLVESLFVLPAHLAHSKPVPEQGWQARVHRRQQRFTQGMISFIDRVYRPVLTRAVAHRYVTLAVAVASLLVIIGVVAGDRIGLTFMPRIEGDDITVVAELPFGAPIEDTRAVQARIVEALEEATAGVGGLAAVSRGLFAQIGDTGVAGGGPGPPGTAPVAGEHLLEVVLFLVPSDQRDVTAGQLTRRWREAVGVIPGVESLRFDFEVGPGADAPINFELRHRNTDLLEQAARELADRLEHFGGVQDVDAGVARGKDQLDFKLKPAARSLGITEANLAQQLRSAFFGAEAVRQQRGRDELRTMVRLPKPERESEYFVETLMLRSPEGQEIPLVEAATMTRGRSFTQIRRTDGQRVINVTADVDDELANANQISADVTNRIMPELQQKYPGLRYGPGGQREEQAETFSALGQNFLLALLAIFALLAIPFRSYVQPIIILTAIPFGFVGAVIGHLVLGYDLSLISMMGFVALSGVVVNGSLVLIHAINYYREEGVDALEAVIDGGLRRFRPIVLTALTTFFGLMPMILETSVQARFLVPMAISLGFGVLFSTGITLLLVPSLYMILEDVRLLLQRVAQGIRE